MAVITELIRVEADNTLSFGNYKLEEKTKLTDFEFDGDLYKVKTFNEITKLEKNGGFVYESVPGSTVKNFMVGADAVSFSVEAEEDVQITLTDSEIAEMKIRGYLTLQGEEVTLKDGVLTLPAKSICILK